MSMSDTDTEDPSGAAPLTLGEKMARDYEARERSMRQVSEVKKRIAKRAAYMDEVSQVRFTRTYTHTHTHTHTRTNTHAGTNIGVLTEGSAVVLTQHACALGVLMAMCCPWATGHA